MKSQLKIDEHKRRMRKRIRDRVRLAGEFLEGAAKLRTPAPTGNLRGSITHQVKSFDTVQVGTAVEYAGFVELGTRFMAPRAYLRGALYDNKAAIKRILQL